MLHLLVITFRGRQQCSVIAKSGKIIITDISCNCNFEWNHIHNMQLVFNVKVEAFNVSRQVLYSAVFMIIDWIPLG